MIEHTLDTGHSILYLRPKSALEQNARCIIAFARHHRAYAGSEGDSQKLSRHAGFKHALQCSFGPDARDACVTGSDLPT
jgi:hypothetical protein